MVRSWWPLLVLAACDWRPIDVDQRVFPCTASTECGAGFSCIGNVCVATGGGSSAGGAGGGSGGGVGPGGGRGGGESDAGVDAGSGGGAVDGGDGGLSGGGAPDDGGASEDGGALDAGEGDAGAFDAGPGDAGAADAGAVDAGPVDAGPDAGLPAADGGAVDAGLDAGRADAGADGGGVDAGRPDAGSVDAGSTPDAAVAVDAGPPPECVNGFCWIDPRPPGPMNGASMVGPMTAVLANDSVIIVVADAGTTVFAHDAGFCGASGRGPNGEIWVSCADRILRLQMSPTPRFQPPLLVTGELSFTRDGGVWRRDNTASGALARWAGFGWVSSLPLCSGALNESLISWSSITTDLAVGTCAMGPLSPSNFKLVSGTQVSALASVDSGVTWLEASDDWIVANGMDNNFQPITLRLLLDGGVQPFPLPAPNSSIFIGADGRPGAITGSGTLRLDESLNWQQLTTGSGTVDFWGNHGVSLAPFLNRVDFFGDFISPSIPSYEPTVTARTQGTFFESTSPRVVMANRAYELRVSGPSFVQALQVSGAPAGLRDGGTAAFGFFGGAYGVSRTLGSTTFAPVPSTQLSSARGLVLFDTGEVLTLLGGVPDGGHLFRVALDGGFQRLQVPLVNPDFLARRSQDSVLLARRNPPVLFEYFLDGGSQGLPTPVTFLNGVCAESSRLYAFGSNGLFFSEDEAQSWRSLDNGFVGAMSCNSGVVAASGSNQVLVSDGGATLRVRLPSSFSSSTPFVDSSRRVWLVNSNGQLILVQ